MFALKTTTAVAALLGTGYYGYSSLDSKFTKHIADQDQQIQMLQETLRTTHDSLVLEKSNRMEQMDQVKTMIEDDKAEAVNQDVTDAWAV